MIVEVTSGRVDSITPDWRGDTLAADVTALDTVLTVKDTADFDELEGDEARWLSIAGDPAVEYVAVDHDANTVTLAAPAGTTYEAGLPVSVFDPTVQDGGAPVVEYEATIVTDRGPVMATVPHGLIPLSGPDFLVGASVSVARDSQGALTVSQVFGREAVVEPDNIGLRWAFGTLLADQTIPDGTWTKITGLFVYTKGITRSLVTPGNFIIEKPAIYDVSNGVQWYSNGTGRRACKVVRHTVFGDIDYFVDSRAAEATAAMSTLAPDAAPLALGDQVSFWVLQTSGAALDIIGPQCRVSITERPGGL